MKKKILIIITVGIIISLLSLSGFSQTTSQLSQNSRTAMGYIPDWAQVVYGINPKTSFRDIGASFYPDFFQFYELLENIGININNDIDGLYQGNERMTTNTNFVIVVIGRVRSEHVTNVVEQYSDEGYRTGNYRGISYYLNTFFADFSEIYHFAIAYVNQNLILLANNETSLREAIDLALGNTPVSESVRGNTQLMQYIENVYGSNLFWMCGFVPDHIKNMFAYYSRLQMFTFVQDMNAIQVAANWNNTSLDIDLSVVCSNNEAATTTESFINAFLPNFIVFTGDDPVFSEILDNLITSVNQNTFHLTVSITQQQILRVKTFVDLMSQQSGSSY